MIVVLEQPQNRIAFNQFPRLIQVIHHFRVWIDTQGMVDGCEDVCRVDRVFEGRRARCVRFPVDLSTAHPCASNQTCVTIGPVVPSIGRVAIARGADAPVLAICRTRR